MRTINLKIRGYTCDVNVIALQCHSFMFIVPVPASISRKSSGNNLVSYLSGCDLQPSRDVLVATFPHNGIFLHHAYFYNWGWLNYHVLMKKFQKFWCKKYLFTNALSCEAFKFVRYHFIMYECKCFWCWTQKTKFLPQEIYIYQDSQVSLNGCSLYCSVFY